MDSIKDECDTAMLEAKISVLERRLRSAHERIHELEAEQKTPEPPSAEDQIKARFTDMMSDMIKFATEGAVADIRSSYVDVMVQNDKLIERVVKLERDVRVRDEIMRAINMHPGTIAGFRSDPNTGSSDTIMWYQYDILNALWTEKDFKYDTQGYGGVSGSFLKSNSITFTRDDIRYNIGKWWAAQCSVTASWNKKNIVFTILNFKQFEKAHECVLAHKKHLEEFPESTVSIVDELKKRGVAP